MLFEPRIGRLALERPHAARVLVLTFLLASPAVWGVVAALTVLWPPLTPVSSWIWLVGIGVAASGTMSLAFDATVRRLYAPLVVLPTVGAMLVSTSDGHIFQPIAACIFLAYIYRASKVVDGDYWSALRLRVELERRAKVLEHLSATDALTQVSNRMHFNRQASVEWARARRSPPAAPDAGLMTVVMVDIDHFKRVNDAHGHPFGDRCLQSIATALQSVLTRPADLLARFGGEEFVALLPGTGSRGAAVVAARMRAAVAAIAIGHGGKSVQLTCSIGVHTVDSREHNSLSTALGQADEALYQAKRDGRDRVVVFDQPAAVS